MLEWSKKVALVDPSNINEYDLTKGFNINCFSKTPKDNLPDAKMGDVLVLRGVKVKMSSFFVCASCSCLSQINEWHGNINGVCPSYKMWSWSLYAPKAGTTKHGGTMTSAAGSDSGSANGSFATAAATSCLDVAETQYSVRLDDWFSGVIQEYETKMGQAIVVQVGEESASTGRRRVHRLIKDAHPSTPPRGFFDCTVEVFASYFLLFILRCLHDLSYRYSTDIEVVTASIRCTLRTTPHAKVSPSLTPTGVGLPLQTWSSGWRFGTRLRRTQNPK